MDAFLAFILDKLLSFLLWMFGWYRSRPNLSVEIRSEEIDPRDLSLRIALTVDMENLGKSATSISKRATVTGVNLVDGETIKGTLELADDDRHLEPHRNRILTFKGSVDAHYIWTWYRKYTFSVTKGADVVLYVDNHDKKPITRRAWFQGRVKGLWRRFERKRTRSSVWKA